jgi:hypothetical protein
MNPLPELSIHSTELSQLFFSSDRRHIRDRIRSARSGRPTRRDCARISGLKNRDFLDMMEEHVCAESLASLAFTPLLAMAWTDGSLSASERGVIFDAADEFGIHQGCPAFDLLGQWLARRPTRRLCDAWISYIRTLSHDLEPWERECFANRLLHYARTLSEMTNESSFLALPRRRAKRVLLRKLAAAFTEST